MNRFVGAVAVALSLALSGSALADNKPAFPMKAADFQQLVDARIAKHRARMEEHIKSKNVDANKAKEKRANFDARVAKIQAAAKQVEADGTVTADEAKVVRATAGEGHKHKR